MKDRKKFSYNKIFIIIFIIGILLSLIYIFKTSTAMLNADSLITDVIAHQQRIQHKFFLNDWWYGNEFWFISLNIPTFILSFFVSNNLLIRQISVFLATIIFFFLIYKYCQEFIDKKSFLIIGAIFATGLSYTILDYFYAFGAYLTVIVNSLILFYFLYKTFTNDSKLYLYFSLFLIFIFCCGSLRYISTIIIPFILTIAILYFYKIHEKKSDNFKYDDIFCKKLRLVIIVSALSFLVYLILASILNFDSKVAMGLYDPSKIVSKILNLISGYFNLFGCDNANNVFKTYTGNGYFLDIEKRFPIYSFWGIMIFIRTLFALSVLFFSKMLFKHFKELDKKVKILLVFNNLSLIITIYLYLVCDLFDVVTFENKYILLNVIIDIILSMYYIYKYILKNKIYELIFMVFMILYLTSNIVFTSDIILKHNNKIIKDKYKIVNVLKDRNLTFGYAYYWDTLTTYFFSDYKIEVANIDFCHNNLIKKSWYTNEKWYEKNYHTGKTFLIVNSENWKRVKNYYNMYGKPKEIIEIDSFKIFVYDSNILSSKIKKECK